MKNSSRGVTGVIVPLLCLVALFVGSMSVPEAVMQPAVAADAEEEPDVPFGLPPVFFPEDNPYSSAKVELGLSLIHI